MSFWVFKWISLLISRGKFRIIRIRIRNTLIIPGGNIDVLIIAYYYILIYYIGHYLSLMLIIAILFGAMHSPASGCSKSTSDWKVASSNPCSGQHAGCWAACRSVLERDTEPYIAHKWGPCDELATCPGSTLPSSWDKAGIGSSSSTPQPRGYKQWHDMTFPSHLGKLTILQKKIIRSMSWAKFDAPSDLLFIVISLKNYWTSYFTQRLYYDLCC